MCVRCVHRMGNARKHTPAARIAARETEVDGIAFMRFLVAFLRCFLNVENAGVLPFEVGKGAVLPGMQTSGVLRDLRIALRQIYKVVKELTFSWFGINPFICLKWESVFWGVFFQNFLKKFYANKKVAYFPRNRGQ